MNTPLPFTLATDLDGTFLHGPAPARARVYALLQGHRGSFGLLFVTGRELERVPPLFEDPTMPRPEHVIADVGTVAVDGQRFQPHAPLRRWVEGAWGQANARVRALLEAEPGLRLQPVDPEFRVSYYYDPARLQPATLARIQDAGFDGLMSDGRYLDVLPRGVSKGPMLLRLLDYLGCPREHVVVCGDTLNDLSLFQTGLLGVAVGNAEAPLVEAVRGMDHVYLAGAEGVEGILEGLRFWRARGRLPPHPLLDERDG